MRKQDAIDFVRRFVLYPMAGIGKAVDTRPWSQAFKSVQQRCIQRRVAHASDDLKRRFDARLAGRTHALRPEVGAVVIEYSHKCTGMRETVGGMPDIRQPAFTCADTWWRQA